MQVSTYMHYRAIYETCQQIITGFSSFNIDYRFRRTNPPSEHYFHKNLILISWKLLELFAEFVNIIVPTRL